MSEFFANGYALLIGVGYAQTAGVNPLPESVSDVEALSALLCDPERAGYKVEHVKKLIESDATTGKIRQGLEWLAEKASSNPYATIIVYFSGHGGIVDGIDSKEYCLVPYDFDVKNKINTAFAGSMFNALINNISAKKLVILYDCCHAAGISTKSFQKNLWEPTNDPSLWLNGGEGKVIVASCEKDQVSIGKTPETPNSLFTTCLLEALDGKNSKPEQYVHITSVLDYLQREVPKRSQKLLEKKLVQQEQRPLIVNASNITSDFYICKSKSVLNKNEDDNMTERMREPTELMIQNAQKDLDNLQREYKLLEEDWKTKSDVLEKDNLRIRKERKQSEIIEQLKLIQTYEQNLKNLTSNEHNY